MFFYIQWLSKNSIVFIKGQDPQHEKNEAKVNNFAYFVELYMEKHVQLTLKK